MSISMEKALKKKQQLAWLNRLQGMLKKEEACEEGDDDSSGDEFRALKCKKKVFESSIGPEKTIIGEPKSLEMRNVPQITGNATATSKTIKMIKKKSLTSRTKSVKEKEKKHSTQQGSLTGEQSDSVIHKKRKRKLQSDANAKISKERKTVKIVTGDEKSLVHVSERLHIESNEKSACASSTMTLDAKDPVPVEVVAAPKVEHKKSTQYAAPNNEKSRMVVKNKPTQMKPFTSQNVTEKKTESFKPQEKDAKASFMIPKKNVRPVNGMESQLTQNHHNESQSDPTEQGEHDALSSDCLDQNDTTSFLGKSCLEEEDRQFLTLAKRYNSFWSACHEKERTFASFKYAVIDEAGKLSPEPSKRQMHCTSLLTMKASKDKFPSSFFGIVDTHTDITTASSQSASEKASTLLNVEEHAKVDSGSESIEVIAAYQKLEFPSREDREWYQKNMYGTCFTPLFLRQPSTLLARKMLFVRKSTGFRFNTKRDKEELIQIIQKRYQVNGSIPRVDIPPRNWQLMMKSQPSTVYLQYRNREDALIASQTLYDDTGQLLLLKNANVFQQDSRTKMSDIQMHMKRSDAHPNFGVSNPIRRSRSRSSSRASASRYRSRSRDKQDIQHRFGRVNGRDASPTVTPLKHDHERASEDGCIPPLVRNTDRSIDPAAQNNGRVWNAHGRGTRSTLGWRNGRDIGGRHAGRMGKNLPHPRSKSRSRSQERYDRRGEMPGRYPRPSTHHNHRNNFFHQKGTHYNRDGPCSLNRSQYDRQDSRKESNAHSVYQRSTVPSYQNPTRH